jgi:ComF family protein
MDGKNDTPFGHMARTLARILFPESPDEAVADRISMEELMSHRRHVRAGAAVAIFPYRDEVVRALLWEVKYKKNARAAELLGYALDETCLRRCGAPHLLIPVPLSRRRLRERGYNQVSMVAHAATRGHSHIEVRDDILVRTRHTPRQTDLPKRERLVNLTGAFAVPDIAPVVGKRIILLDDIVTTGTTLREAAAVLRDAGAKEVRCVALAH